MASPEEVKENVSEAKEVIEVIEAEHSNAGTMSLPIIVIQLAFQSKVLKETATFMVWPNYTDRPR